MIYILGPKTDRRDRVVRALHATSPRFVASGVDEMPPHVGLFDIVVCVNHRKIEPLRKPGSNVGAGPRQLFVMHDSLLPSFRGCAPLAWAIIANKPLGLTLIEATNEVDAGPIIDQEPLPDYINRYDEAYDALTPLYVNMLLRNVSNLVAGTYTSQIQCNRVGDFRDITYSYGARRIPADSIITPYAHTAEEAIRVVHASSARFGFPPKLLLGGEYYPINFALPTEKSLYGMVGYSRVCPNGIEVIMADKETVYFHTTPKVSNEAV